MMMVKKERIIRILNISVILLFALLIYKDPFSQRTLVSNFEPYPDTFNYINPALSFAKGEGFKISREGRSLHINVPPLYSVSLMPFFFIKADPRMAYYGNVVMAFASLFFLWLILLRIFTNKLRLLLRNKLFIYTVLIFYITNYFIYWFPSIVMAENLTLMLFLMSLYFLISKTTLINLATGALLAISIYAAKYSNLPTMAVIIFLYIGKIIFSTSSIKKKSYKIMFFLLTAIFSFSSLAVFEQFVKGHIIISQIFGHLSLIYKSVPQDSTETSVTVGSSWFGIQYISQNLPLYIKSLFGMPNKFLWDYTPLVPKFVALAGLVGIIWGLFIKKFFLISFALLIFLVSAVIFMSTFYSFDARYIYIVIPILLIGFGLFLSSFERRFYGHKIFSFLVFIFIFIFISFHLLTSFSRIKSQISLNLRYAETPWNYISVLKMNEYFSTDKIVNNKKPILISALPPFLIDYYSNRNYKILPLSYEQEFRGQEVRQTVWGPDDYSDLLKLYRKYLNEGYDVYVSRAGLGNEGYTNRDFNTIVEEFDTKLVQPGCFNQCNIYSVKLIEKNAN